MTRIDPTILEEVKGMSLAALENFLWVKGYTWTQIRNYQLEALQREVATLKTGEATLNDFRFQ